MHDSAGSTEGMNLQLWNHHFLSIAILLRDLMCREYLFSPQRYTQLALMSPSLFRPHLYPHAEDHRDSCISAPKARVLCVLICSLFP